MTAPTLPDIAKTEIAIVEMTNDFRKKNGLNAVTHEFRLMNAARAFAIYLARTGKFAHEADGRQPSERVQTAGYQYCFVAENLALSQSSAGFETRDLARRMVEGWINSPGHRKNMLVDAATETAVAIARGPDGDPKYVAVQLFARPRHLAYEFQVSNNSGDTIRYIFGEKPQEVKSGLAIIHTACLPESISFDAPRAGSAPLGSYEAKDGMVFEIKKVSGSYRVNVRQKERIGVPGAGAKPPPAGGVTR